ncbi:MAG: hypothetical protein KKF89_01045 [Nanoarchaeota archaeon]|nr:hypothetical protein [Nanoarchaeota archaeon]MBU1854284.1 hypothetical protein [Nanoarchaeota archaeon]
MKQKKNNGIKESLIEIKRIFDSWGIDRKDWALMIHFADILQGYELKKSLRSGPPHLNIVMRASAIPWKINEDLLGVDAIIPKNTRFANDISEFHKKFNCDFDIVPESDESFNTFSKDFVNHTIAGHTITLLSVLGDLKYTEKSLEDKFEEWGSKSQRVLLKVKEISEIAEKKNDKEILKCAQRILSKYKIEESKELDVNKEIKGICAHRGKVIGKALVVTDNDSDPFNKVLSIKEGMVLVVPLTRPPYMPAIQKCCALVTDEGGVLSHAAIIAREMNKPCVIGTKNATKILKDGDLVEVDATKGEVKKLSEDWVLRWESVHPFFRMNCFFNGHKKKQILGSDYSKLLGISRNNKIQMYYSQNDLERKSEQALSMFNDNNKLSKYLKFVKKNNFELIKEIKGLLTQKNLSEKVFIKKYESCMIRLECLLASYDLSRPEFFVSVEKEVKDNLKNKILEGDLNEIFTLLTTNTKRTLLNQEELDRLDIALRIHKHQQKYGWIGTSESEEPWDVEHFKLQLDEDLKLSFEELIKKISDKEHHEANTEQKQKELAKRLKISKSTNSLLEIIKTFSHLRLNTRLKWVRAGYLMRFVFKEIEKRTSVNSKNLEKYTLDEMMNLLENNVRVSSEELDARDDYAFLLVDDELNFFRGKEVKLLEEEQIEKVDYSIIKEVRGMVANSGKVTGKVRVINALTENQDKAINDMKQGEVLVTGMTRPHLIVAMKKASAIVTDEGGITSHAAIISRELGKPCIIGTKIATKVFKDGDLVEVDGSKGLVRKK